MTSLAGGFVDPAVQSAEGFRALLESMARPGRIHRVTGALPPAPIPVAAGVALLVLCDDTTSLHLASDFDTPAARDWITFHTGAPLVGANDAQFALGSWTGLQPVDRFAPGDPAWPDRSATLIVALPRLVNDGPWLTGPGIEQGIRLSLPETATFQANRALFPLGFDVILTCGDLMAALPRSTRVEEA